MPCRESGRPQGESCPEQFQANDAFRFIGDPVASQGDQILTIETAEGELDLKATVTERREGGRRSRSRISVPRQGVGLQPAGARDVRVSPLLMSTSGRDSSSRLPRPEQMCPEHAAQLLGTGSTTNEQHADEEHPQVFRRPPVCAHHCPSPHDKLGMALAGMAPVLGATRQEPFPSASRRQTAAETHSSRGGFLGGLEQGNRVTRTLSCGRGTHISGKAW
jgi:hypothetical protein